MKQTSIYVKIISNSNYSHKSNNSNTKRLISFAAIGLTLFLLQGQTSAQTSTQSTLQTNTQDAAQFEPPSRVARVGYSYGQVSFADAGSNEWTPLIANRPISTGDSIFVPERGRAELHVGANALRLSEETRISFAQLSDDQTHIQLSQGSISIQVRALFDKERFDISTPNLLFAIQEPGEYRINVNEDNTTTVIVRRGIGIAQGSRDVITIAEGEQTRFIGTNLRHTQITQAPAMDTFDLWALDRSRAEENSVSARYVSREVIGYQQLDQYGSWENSIEYGSVWYPRNMSSQWAPYRDGQWVWVSPWGWTWVDSAPWGFAPYHYGRWAQVRSRWAWIPGPYRRDHRPVYAPALVAFVGSGGNGVNVGINISSGHSHGFNQSVSWFPLGPHDTYRPSYTRNPRYIRNINQTIIHNTTIINGNNNQVYINQRVKNAVTSVPTHTFIRGERIRPDSSSILSGQVRQLQAMTQAPNLTPEKGNRYGETRGNYINSNNNGNYNRNTNANADNNRNQRPTETATVYGSGIYAGGRALPVTPKPEESSFRPDRNDRRNGDNRISDNRNANNNNGAGQSNNTISTNTATPVAATNNNANSSFRTIEENNDRRGQVRFNAERFDPNSVSENTRRNEAYRNTPNNPRAENNPVNIPVNNAVMTAPQEPTQLHTVPRPTQENERAVQTQQFRSFERPNPVAREEREVRVQRERPQEVRSESRAASIEMRAPREAPQQAARVEQRAEPRMEAPARQGSERTSSKNENKINIE